MKRQQRRQFLKTAAVGLSGFTILPNAQSAFGYQANERIGAALIGCGGRGSWFVGCVPRIGCNIVAMCDANWKRAAEGFKKLPDPPKYRDFRKMLDEKGSEIDCVFIAVPDHNHAPISAYAMRAGKHVLCEKPLTRTVEESRALRALARKCEVATQLGNQGTATHAYREQVELIQSGLLGPIKEVIVWNTGGGVGPRDTPEGSQPVPEWLAWDVWLGPRASRPYHRDWMHWHRWRDFATGQLGNWGVHSSNIVFRGLRLNELWQAPDNQGKAKPPKIRVEAKVSEIVHNTFPKWEIITYAFPGRGDLPPIDVTWYNGLHAPGLQEKFQEIVGRPMVAGGPGPWHEHAGALVVWEDGFLLSNGHNTEYSLLPEERFQDFERPEATLPRSGSHEREFVAACKGGPPALSNFDYGGPLTEFLMLGNIATRIEGPIEFSPWDMAITNNTKAAGLLKADYREGWRL
ncbi:MAG: Gfo/Idh/MocA family protein [Planctomycetota bacterium]